jgi:hypothetical protein
MKRDANPGQASVGTPEELPRKNSRDCEKNSATAMGG